jgi:hypothetical protein
MQILTVTVLFPPIIPWAILLSWIPLIYLLYKPLAGLNRARCLKTSAYSIIITWLIVEIGSAAFLFLHRERIYPFPMDFERKIASLSINFMYSLQPTSIWLLILLGFSWTIAPILMLIKVRRRISISLIDHPWLGNAILLVGITLSVMAIAIHFIRNPDFFGIDTGYYLERLSMIEDPGVVLKQLSNDPRLLYLLLLKGLDTFGLSPELSIKVGPLLLMGLNVCAFYLIGKEMVGSRLAGGLVGAFTALGMQTSVSLYAGIYANWFALSLGALSFTFYLIAVRTRRILYLILTWLFLILCVTAHPWSGVPFAFTLFLGSLLDVASTRLKDKLFLIGELGIASSIVLGGVAVYLYPPYRGLIGSLIGLLPSFSLSNLNSLTFNLSFNMDYMVGGFMSAPILYISALIGFLGLWLDKGNSSGTRLVSVWLAVTWLPILLAEQWLQWRLIYLIPIQLLMGLGVYYISSSISKTGDNMRATLTALLLSAIILAMFNYLLRNVSFIPSI